MDLALKSCPVVAVCLVPEASMEVYFSGLRLADCTRDATVAAMSVPSTLHLAVPVSA